jgi:hypothetical protein
MHHHGEEIRNIWYEGILLNVIDAQKTDF